MEHVKREVPFRVATCWNGAVVFPAEPYIYRNETRESVNLKRGWKMLDLRESFPPFSHYPVQAESRVPLSFLPRGEDITAARRSNQVQNIRHRRM